MIDFINPEYTKLITIPDNKAVEAVKALLNNEEKVIVGFKTVRDKVIFTNKRIIAINVQGVTGRKVAYTSIPYNKIQSFCIETAGTFDLESELDIWISSVGKVRFEMAAGYDIRNISKLISESIL